MRSATSSRFTVDRWLTSSCSCLRPSSVRMTSLRDTSSFLPHLQSQCAPLRGLLKNDASPLGRDRRGREKDAGSANSSAIGATEDALSPRPARSGGRGFVLQQPFKAGAALYGAGTYLSTDESAYPAAASAPTRAPRAASRARPSAAARTWSMTGSGYPRGPQIPAHESPHPLTRPLLPHLLYHQGQKGAQVRDHLGKRRAGPALPGKQRIEEPGVSRRSSGHHDGRRPGSFDYGFRRTHARHVSRCDHRYADRPHDRFRDGMIGISAVVLDRCPGVYPQRGHANLLQPRGKVDAPSAPPPATRCAASPSPGLPTRRPLSPPPPPSPPRGRDRPARPSRRPFA